MLLALQLQSFPAMALLLCQDNLPTRTTSHQISHAESQINQQSDQQSDLSECDDCIFCHASFNFCTPLENPSLQFKLSSTVFLFYIPHFYQFISELPQRPPKNSL
jgi:hypothetical protein